MPVPNLPPTGKALNSLWHVQHQSIYLSAVCYRCRCVGMEIAAKLNGCIDTCLQYHQWSSERDGSRASAGKCSSTGRLQHSHQLHHVCRWTVTLRGSLSLEFSHHAVRPDRRAISFECQQKNRDFACSVAKHDSNAGDMIQISAIGVMPRKGVKYYRVASHSVWYVVSPISDTP